MVKTYCSANCGGQVKAGLIRLSAIIHRHYHFREMDLIISDSDSS